MIKNAFSWLLFTALFTAVLYSVLGPIGDPTGTFHSDSAIPIIMIHAQKITPFEFYYYAQDRLGGWPYIVQWGFRNLFYADWGARLTYVFQLFVFGLGIAVWARRWTSQIMALLATGLLCVASPTLLSGFLHINNPYAIQSGMCFLYWGCMQHIYPSGSSRQHLLWGAVALIAAFLAAWTSPASFCFLFSVSFWELAWHAQERSTQAKGTRTFVAVMPFLALGFERLLRAGYASYTDRTYAWELENLHFRYETPMTIHWHEIPGKFWHYCVTWFNAEPVGLTLIVLGGTFLLLWLVRYPHLFGKHAVPQSLKAPYILYSAGLSGMVAISGVDWIIRNGSGMRYAMPSVYAFYMGTFFLGFAALKTLRTHAAQHLQRWLTPGCAALYGSLAGLFLMLAPPLSRWEHFNQLEEHAANMAASGKTIVLGPYWNTYLWQGLNPAGILAIPGQEHTTRTPHAHQKIKGAATYIGCGPLDLNQSKFGVTFQIQSPADPRYRARDCTGNVLEIAHVESPSS